MKLVILESPYAGDIEANLVYARRAMHDSLSRGEAPIASHLLYTQPGILKDEVPEERIWGIKAGLAWRPRADYSVFYTDRQWSSGMLGALHSAINEGRKFYIRALDGMVQLPASLCEDMDMLIQKSIDQNFIP